MTPRFRHLFPAIAFATLAASTTLSAQGLTVKEEKPGLLAKAKVTAEAAFATARGAVPTGKHLESEIEEEDGRLVFVFTFKPVGRRGEDEVLVDALTGKLVKTEHETPADEAKEKAQGAATQTLKKKPAPGR